LTTRAFVDVALRRDLLLAPPSERRPIFEQVRGFQTRGEAALYVRAVQTEIARSRPRPETAPARHRRRIRGRPQSRYGDPTSTR
jgi:hypothetical protein